MFWVSAPKQIAAMWMRWKRREEERRKKEKTVDKLTTEIIKIEGPKRASDSFNHVPVMTH
jgi:hypothetical protein